MPQIPVNLNRQVSRAPDIPDVPEPQGVSAGMGQGIGQALSAIGGGIQQTVQRDEQARSRADTANANSFLSQLLGNARDIANNTVDPEVISKAYGDVESAWKDWVSGDTQGVPHVRDKKTKALMDEHWKRTQPGLKLEAEARLRNIDRATTRGRATTGYKDAISDYDPERMALSVDLLVEGGFATPAEGSRMKEEGRRAIDMGQAMEQLRKISQGDDPKVAEEQLSEWRKSVGEAKTLTEDDQRAFDQKAEVALQTVQNRQKATQHEAAQYQAKYDDAFNLNLESDAITAGGYTPEMLERVVTSTVISERNRTYWRGKITDAFNKRDQALAEMQDKRAQAAQKAQTEAAARMESATLFGEIGRDINGLRQSSDMGDIMAIEARIAMGDFEREPMRAQLREWLKRKQEQLTPGEGESEYQTNLVNALQDEATTVLTDANEASTFARPWKTDRNVPEAELQRGIAQIHDAIYRKSKEKGVGPAELKEYAEGILQHARETTMVDYYLSRLDERIGGKPRKAGVADYMRDKPDAPVDGAVRGTATLRNGDKVQGWMLPDGTFTQD